MARTTARAAAMQMVYERQLGGQGGGETLELVYEQLGEGGESAPSADDQMYIEDVLTGVYAHQAEIDANISEFSVDWSLERMAKVDLTILRLATYEILFREDVPGSVAINEAVELAGKYSDPAGGRFINGVLGSILRKKEAAKQK
jgi:N utilization substance protein B